MPVSHQHTIGGAGDQDTTNGRRDQCSSTRLPRLIATTYDGIEWGCDRAGTGVFFNEDTLGVPGPEGVRGWYS
jgi:hypothetical protein